MRRALRRWAGSAMSGDGLPPGVRLLRALGVRRVSPALQRAGVLALTYAAYASFHVTRKPLSVVKATLQGNCSGCGWAPFDGPEGAALLGALDAAFLVAYAAAMLLSGMAAERVPLRPYLGIGMLLSALACDLFGLGYTLDVHSVWYYAAVQAAAGVLQTSGWPAVVAVVGKWFPRGNQGLLFGVWNSHTSVGNIIGSVMAARWAEGEWALCFTYPAAVMGGAALLVLLFLVPEPPEGAEGGAGGGEGGGSVNAEEGERERLLPAGAAGAGAGGERRAVSLRAALALPGAAHYCVSLFFGKLVSYTLMYWLPAWLAAGGRGAGGAGRLAAAWDAGGVAGGAAAGWAADRWAPALVCVVLYAGAAPALWALGAGGGWALLAGAGALVAGPYSLITTAVAARLGAAAERAGGGARATLAALLDGAGSAGAALGPLLAGVLAQRSWSLVFVMLLACDLLALLPLLPLAFDELRRMRAAASHRARLD